MRLYYSTVQLIYTYLHLNGMILSIYQKEGISRIVAVWCKCTHNVLFLLCYPNNQPHLMLYIGTTTTSNIKGVHRRRYVVTSFCYCCISVVVEDASFTPLPSLIICASRYHRLFMFILSLVFTMWCESNIVYIGKPFTYNVIMY